METSLIIICLVFCLPMFCCGTALEEMGCAEGWIYYSNHCYLIKGGSVSKADAIEVCKQRNGTLATLHTTGLTFLYTQAHKACKDGDRKCWEFADQGQCVMPLYRDWMRQNCRFSCGLCTSLCHNVGVPGMLHSCGVASYKDGCAADLVESEECSPACECGGFGDNFWIGEVSGTVSLSAGSSRSCAYDKVDDMCVSLDVRRPLKRSVVDSPCKCVSPQGYICQKATHSIDADEVARDADKRGCPANGFSYNNRCFIYNEALRTRHEADSDCKRQGGMLASLQTRELAEIVHARLKYRYPSFWIGLRKELEENVYTWENQDKVEYLPWGAEHTGSEGDLCVQMLTSTPGPLFQAASCGDTLGSLCETPRKPEALHKAGTSPKPELHACKRAWQEEGDFCYRLFLEPLTWQTAQEECEKHEGNLMSLHSKAKLSLVNSYFEAHHGLGRETASLDGHGLWIGLRRHSRNTPIEWTDGSPYDFSTISNHRDFSDMGLEEYMYCMKIQHDDSWYETSCSSKLPFICQVYRGLEIAGNDVGGTSSQFTSSTTTITMPTSSEPVPAEDVLATTSTADSPTASSTNVGFEPKQEADNHTTTTEVDLTPGAEFPHATDGAIRTASINHTGETGGRLTQGAARSIDSATSLHGHDNITNSTPGPLAEASTKYAQREDGLDNVEEPSSGGLSKWAMLGIGGALVALLVLLAIVLIRVSRHFLGAISLNSTSKNSPAMVRFENDLYGHNGDSIIVFNSSVSAASSKTVASHREVPSGDKTVSDEDASLSIANAVYGMVQN